MKYIELSKQGKHKGKYFAIVDDEDYERVNSFNWCVKIDTNTFYAKRSVKYDKQRITIYMQRFILDVIDKNVHVDHINGDGLDNRKENIRICSNKENSMNKKPFLNKASIYKGVSFKRKKSIRAQIGINNKKIHLGTFRSEIEAAQAYDIAAKKYFGEFANLNFPEL